MSSPHSAARTASAKKTPEKKVDLTTQTLARKRSQDFASKIAGWNSAGGGVQQQNEIVVIEDPPSIVRRSKKSDDALPIVVETESSAPAQDELVAIVQEFVPDNAKTPKSPLTPGRATRKAAGTLSGTKKAGRDVDLGRGAWVRKKSKPQVEIPTDVKHAGAPKKRVVSDGHWRRDKPPKVEGKANPENDETIDTTPKPVIVRRSGVLSMGMKVPPSYQEFSASDPEPDPVRVRPLKYPRSSSRSRSPTGRGATLEFESTGTKVYIKRRARSRTAVHLRKSETSLTAPSSVDKTGTVDTDITTPSSSPSRPKSEPRERTRKSRSRDDEPRSKSAKQSPNTEERATRRRRSKTAFGDSGVARHPSVSAEAFAKRITQSNRKPTVPVAATALKPHSTRIEGWLAEMPDPFTESTRSSLTPEPLDIPKKTRPKPQIEVEYDHVTIGESRRSSLRTRSTRKDDDLGVETRTRRSETPESEVSPQSPTTLKRRGAKRNNDSAIKTRMSREIMPDEPTSFDAVMSGANPDVPRRRRRTPSAKKNDKFRIPSGQRLPTIACDATLQARGHGRAYSDDATTTFEGSVLSRASDGDSPRRRPSGLKRRSAKQDDLMSVLSMERRTRDSRRSVRHSQRRSEAATIGHVMNDLSADELKYQRELRTLVDGVIPVLLQHALSVTGSSSKARVFSRPTNDEVTRPIVEMGVALERLKTTHRRIPLHEPSDLLIWADGASKVYADYLKVWRLGFKDIVVNLAPAELTKQDTSGWDHDLPRNENGDLIDGVGERVDVAHLLKRPLVRLKSLVKTLKSINVLKPSANAEDMTAKYHDLIGDAKKRVNDEQARLEDEAAASIDATRARDPRSLAPITGVTIDPTRSVRARDYLDMDLVHSSGQQLGCKIEIIFRDDAPNRGTAGDVLFCEISVSGRWLLFPPIPWSLVSARAGERPGELVVMIRGFLSNAQQWREVMSLRAETDDTSSDWLKMLGSAPMPPRLNRRSSYNMFKQHNVPAPALEEREAVTANNRDTTDKSRDPSPREIEVPIGEQVKSSSRIWDGSEVNSVCHDDAVTSTNAQRAKAKRYRSMTTSQSIPEVGYVAQPTYFYEQPRTRNILEETIDRRPKSAHIRSQSEWTSSMVSTDRTSEYSVWMPSSDRDTSRYSDEETIDDNDQPRHSTARPGMHRRRSSVPSLGMPTIPKVRQPSRPESPTSDRDGLPSQKRAAADTERRLPSEASSVPPKLQRTSLGRKDPNERPPAPPFHESKPRPLSLGLNIVNKIPSLTPAFLKKSRRPSSPLKHEYEPSTASESLSDSEFSDEFSDDDSDTSEGTVYDTVDYRAPLTEDGVSTVGDLQGFKDYAMKGLRHSSPPATEPSSRFSISGASLAPSESASQAPYRTVPPTAVEPGKTVASICAWSERGTWDSLHPEECQIFITPGLIEAFDLVQANCVQLNDEGTTPSAKGIKPLVALELTPLVPLRRGTAVDISIRSPPSANSLLKSSSNIMFRSRSPEDCERLYALINRARIDNPTYIALQNARGPVQQSNWGEIMDQRPNPMDKRRSWWNLGSRKSSTYRSQGSRASTAATESSVGTVGTAFSALRRFSNGSNIFNIGKSTITSRDGTRSTNSGSLSSGTATPIQFHPSVGTPLGINNAKVRMYMRESAGRWRDMGAARLTVLLPPRQDPTIAANPRVTGLEKRVIVTGKSKGETMLDVTLGESAFERVARTGIAVSVYEESPHVGASGGVLPHSTTVYMIQLKSEREAAYTFGMVGKLRY